MATKTKTVKKTTAKKTPAKKVTAKPKEPAKKAAPQVTKVQQAVDIVTKARKAKKNITRKEVIALIAKQLKCAPLRAAGHYQAAIKRI